MRSGGTLTAALVVAAADCDSGRAHVNDVEARGPSAAVELSRLARNDSVDVRDRVLLTTPPTGPTPLLTVHAARVPALVVASPGTCGLLNGCAAGVGVGRLLMPASRTLSNLGIARFIGDVVDVKFMALSTPDNNASETMKALLVTTNTNSMLDLSARNHKFISVICATEYFHTIRTFYGPCRANSTHGIILGCREGGLL